jgi:hypothetical protein
MSERAVEFVETWVEDKIEEIGDLAQADSAQVKALAAQCVKAALDQGIPESEINDAFDDLAAFIAGEIEEARYRETRPDEGMMMVDGDDERVVDEEEDEDAEDEDEEDEDAKDDKNA